MLYKTLVSEYNEKIYQALKKIEPDVKDWLSPLEKDFIIVESLNNTFIGKVQYSYFTLDHMEDIWNDIEEQRKIQDTADRDHVHAGNMLYTSHP